MNKGKKTNDFPFTDDELRAAAARAEEKLMEQYDDLEGYTYTFSEEFEQTMDQFFRKLKRRSQVFEATKRVAAVFAAAVIVAGAWLTFDVNARASVFDWMKSIYKGSIVYLYGGEEEPETLPKYELSWLPDGFAKMDETNDGTRSSTLYINSKTADFIVFEYDVIHNLSNVTYTEVNTPKTHEKVEFGGIAADFYHATENDDKTNHLIWTDEQEEIVFSIDSSLDKTTVIQIAEGVTALSN